MDLYERRTTGLGGVRDGLNGTSRTGFPRGDDGTPSGTGWFILVNRTRGCAENSVPDVMFDVALLA